MTKPTYPKRPPFFANRFCRLMTKVCLANQIGPEACYLLMTVAMVEDAKSYRGAVTFWNEQLMPLIGVNTTKALIRTRKRAIDAGWLHYEAGRKGVVARYWVVVPAEYEGMDDFPVDERPEEYRSSLGAGLGVDSGSESGMDTTPKVAPIRHGKGQGYDTESGNLSSLSCTYPLPLPADGTEGASEPRAEAESRPAEPRSAPAPGRSADRPPIGQPRAANAIPPSAEDDPLKADDRLKKTFLAAWNGSGLRAVEKKAFNPYLLGCLKQRLTDDYWRENWEAAVAKAGKDPFYAKGEGWGNAGPLDVAEFLKNEDLVRRIVNHVPGTAGQPLATRGKPPVVHRQDEY